MLGLITIIIMGLVFAVGAILIFDLSVVGGLLIFLAYPIVAVVAIYYFSKN